ncbi:MAG: hypothetical protein ACE5JG_09670 [Planctomycetota bacterium]
MGRLPGCGVLILLATAVRAGEPDGAVAAAARWTDPRGAASGSLSSRALPVVRDVREAWTCELPGAPTAPPVHWDGTAYLVCETRPGRVLVAVDLARGAVVARRTLGPGVPARPVVWDHIVVVRLGPSVLGGVHAAGHAFNRVWRFRLERPREPDAVVSDPVVYENEVYVVFGGTLQRLRLRHSTAVWSAAGSYHGRPAVYGRHVYILRHRTTGGERDGLYVEALRRRDGGVAGTAACGQYQRGGRPSWREEGRITVTPRAVYVLAPRPLRGEEGAYSCAAVRRRGGAGSVVLETSRHLYPTDLAVATHREGALLLSEGRRWSLWTEEGGRVLADAEYHPDLFRNPVPATVLGDVVYFGSWAADLRTREILWRLPLDRVTFQAVPADRLILVVDGARLRAFRGRS